VDRSRGLSRDPRGDEPQVADQQAWERAGKWPQMKRPPFGAAQQFGDQDHTKLGGRREVYPIALLLALYRARGTNCTGCQLVAH
jgi:hypothetical protein